MLRLKVLLGMTLALTFGVALGGCADSKQGPATADAQAESGADADHEHGDAGHADHDIPDHAADQATIDAELAKLAPDDMKLAEAQDKMCPVSDHALGSMGAPIKVKDVNGKDVFICCEGCEEELRKNPDKYLAKIKSE